MLSKELRFHRLNLDSFKTPYIHYCILEMQISDVLSDLTIEVGSTSFALHKVFLKDAVFPNISNSISVLHRCETLLPVSEEVNLVSQLTNAIVNSACKEQLTSGLSRLEYNFLPKPAQCVDSETPSDW
ncbi:BTB/POZ domain-containing protein [Capsicum chinense]|nr:BTB/POZ domain-containing protein [Capsicum chinense]